MADQIKIGDKVQMGVFVARRWRPTLKGIVTNISHDGTLATIDAGTMHGCEPDIYVEPVALLRGDGY